MHAAIAMNVATEPTGSAARKEQEKEDARKEQEKEDAEKEAARKEQEKAPWDNEAEWAWHDAHVEAWQAADAAAAAAADEERQKAQKEYELERVLDDLFDSPIPDPLQTPRTRGRVADWLQIELDDLFGGSPSKKTCRRQQQPEEEVQDSQQDFWR